MRMAHMKMSKILKTMFKNWFLVKFVCNILKNDGLRSDFFNNKQNEKNIKQSRWCAGNHCSLELILEIIKSNNSLKFLKLLEFSKGDKFIFCQNSVFISSDLF